MLQTQVGRSVQLDWKQLLLRYFVEDESRNWMDPHNVGETFKWNIPCYKDFMNRNFCELVIIKESRGSLIFRHRASSI